MKGFRQFLAICDEHMDVLFGLVLLLVLLRACVF